MGKIISVVNRKGGVGKTTLSIAIADAFVTEEKASVAVVDLDPQASATRTVLHDDLFLQLTENNSNLVALVKDILHTKLLPESLSDYRQGMRHPFRHDSDVDFAIYPNNDSFWEVEAAEIEKGGGSRNLTEQLYYLIGKTEGHDYVIVDCPPGESASSLAALRASDLVLCPVTTDKMSLWGKDLLFKYIEKHDLDNTTKFVASKVSLRTKAGIEAFKELQHAEDMLLIEGGKIGAGGTPNIARFTETADVNNRITKTSVGSLKNIYGKKGAEELRSIVKAIRREVDKNG